MTDAPAQSDGWLPEVDELRRRRRDAQALGGGQAVARHHERGRLTIRERIDGLVDNGSFSEVGTLAGQGRYEGARLTGVTPAPYVMGLASIDGRPVAVGGEDFTI
jgi:acetyl-CoA carboxylase carboxyltransferase component